MRKAITLALVAGALTVASNAMAYDGEPLARNAKITLEQARTVAVKARSGTITDQELEKEKGGSGLRYSFDIKQNGKTFEVGVDAMTGAVLENGPDGDRPD